MESHLLKRNEQRIKRSWRVRKHVKGSAGRPRLSISKTNKHIAVQLIDDDLGVTLAGIGTMSKEFRAPGFKGRTKEAARQVGTRIAQLAKEKQIEAVVFDRGRFKFHGIVAELANAARAAGLQF